MFIFNSVFLKRIILSFFFFLFLLGVYAHQPNQSYVYLQVYENNLTGRYEVRINDLNTILSTDFSSDVTIEEINEYRAEIIRYYKSNSTFSSGDEFYEVQFDEMEIREINLVGTFVFIPFKFPEVSVVPDNLTARYNVLFDEDRDHKGFLIIEYNWKAGIHNNESIPSMFFDSQNRTDTVDLTDGSILRGFLSLIREGIWHIWIGIDHILFLLALILPSVIVRSRNREQKNQYALSTIMLSTLRTSGALTWTPVERFRPAFIYIIKIVTFFTISHTITLGLAAFGVIIIPSRIIESVIAFSIALAAYHNIQPIFRGKEWMIAFVFGLFHGFGFASVLSNIQAGEYLGYTLLGFNLGVEIGQVVIIAILFPILFLIRKKVQLYNYLLILGSILLIFISLYWFTERAFEIDIKGLDFLRSIFNL